MKYLIVLSIILSILFMIGLVWFSILFINEIHEIGLKGIVDQIWYGEEHG